MLFRLDAIAIKAFPEPNGFVVFIAVYQYADYEEALIQ